LDHPGHAQGPSTPATQKADKSLGTVSEVALRLPIDKAQGDAEFTEASNRRPWPRAGISHKSPFCAFLWLTLFNEWVFEMGCRHRPPIKVRNSPTTCRKNSLSFSYKR